MAGCWSSGGTLTARWPVAALSGEQSSEEKEEEDDDEVQEAVVLVAVVVISQPEELPLLDRSRLAAASTTVVWAAMYSRVEVSWAKRRPPTPLSSEVTNTWPPRLDPPPPLPPVWVAGCRADLLTLSSRSSASTERGRQR